MKTKLDCAAQLLENVPYYLTQRALGVEYGDFASHYDSDATKPYGSRFMNEVGGAILEFALKKLGPTEFDEHADALFNPDLITPAAYELPESPDAADFNRMSAEVSASLIEHLHNVFPDIDVEEFAQFTDSIEAFLRPYIEAEYADHHQASYAKPATPNA